MVGAVEKPVYGAEGDFIEKFRPTSRISILLSHLARYIGQMTLLARWRDAYRTGQLAFPDGVSNRPIREGSIISDDIKAGQTAGNAHASSSSNQFRDQSAESSFRPIRRRLKSGLNVRVIEFNRRHVPYINGCSGDIEDGAAGIRYPILIL